MEGGVSLSHGPPVVVGQLGSASAANLYGVGGPRSTTSASTSSSSSQSPPIAPIVSSGSTAGGKMSGSTSNGGRKYQCKMCPQVGVAHLLLFFFFFSLFRFLPNPSNSLTRALIFNCFIFAIDLNFLSLFLLLLFYFFYHFTFSNFLGPNKKKFYTFSRRFSFVLIFFFWMIFLLMEQFDALVDAGLALPAVSQISLRNTQSSCVSIIAAFLFSISW